MMAERYKDGAVLVTGGGSGLGEAICVRLAAEGASVAVVDRDQAAAERVAEAIRETGRRAVALVADVTDFGAMASAVAATVAAFGGLDVAVNNAGIGCPFLPTAEHTPEGWNKVIAVNLTGVFLSMKAELPTMSARGGVIVNMASVSSTVGLAGVAPYVAAKHGVLGLTKAAALEYGKNGIRVCAVCPTFVKTPLTLAELKGDEQWAALDAMHPLGHCATPDDVAGMVAFLGSADAAMCTGNGYLVDGGFSTP